MDLALSQFLSMEYKTKSSAYMIKDELIFDLGKVLICIQ